MRYLVIRASSRRPCRTAGSSTRRSRTRTRSSSIGHGFYKEYATRTKFKWAGRRVCIDLFASCGIYRNAETGELGWGSPLLALHAVNPFDVYIFGDKDAERARVLADRVDDSGRVAAEAVRLSVDDPDVVHQAREFKALSVRGPKCAVMTGDANLAVRIVKLMMPAFERRRMALTMLDPYGVAFH